MIKNNINSKYLNSNFSKKIHKKFEKIFIKINEDIKNTNKTLNVLDSKLKLNFRVKDLNKFRKFKSIAIIGMGGSILGAEAIYNFLEKKIKKKIYFFNNLDEKEIINFKKKRKLSKVLFIIISKSGNTVETLANTFSLNILKKKSKNIIIISEKKDNALIQLVKKYNLYYFEHKNYIGGRYSVLSEVGIIPAYLMGVNIDKLRSKTLFFLKGRNKSVLKDSTIKIANILNSKKLNNLIFLNYSPKLEKFLFWCQQLVAESLGKKNKGFLPMISSVPKDHHSLLQLYLDGPKDKIYYIFSMREKSKIIINSKNKIKINSFLNNKRMNNIKLAQKNALIKAFRKKNIPFREFHIEKNDEQFLGIFFSYFIIETVLIGKLINTNPFDQPAVEQVKKYTKQLLN